MMPTYRTIWLSLLAGLTLAPSSLFAMTDKDRKDPRKKERVAQLSDSTKTRKAKSGPSDDEMNLGKKKGKSRGVPSPNSNAKPQDDDAGDALWDTEFLVRNSVPGHRGVLVYTSY